MKKEERSSAERERKQEGKFSGSEADNDEYGFEYDFFITEKSSETEKISTPLKNITQDRGKAQESKDQSKTFFLPDFFSYED
jgi:inosine/xanthosine triphosphate pyrophosphatase family protein